MLASVPGSGIEMQQQQLRLQIFEHIGMRQHRRNFTGMDGDSDLRKGTVRFGDFQLGRRIWVRINRLWCAGAAVGDPELDRLMVAHSALHHVRPRESERPHISLVGGIRPVSLVFHFEYVPRHEATRGDAWRYWMLDRTNLLKRLRRCNEIRKGRLLARP